MATCRPIPLEAPTTSATGGGAMMNDGDEVNLGDARRYLRVASRDCSVKTEARTAQDE